MADLVWYSRTEDIPRQVWRDCFPSPQEGLFWFNTLESARIGDQFTFFFGLLRDGGATIGIAPAFLFDLPIELVLPSAAARAAAIVGRTFFRKFTRVRTFFIGSVAGEEGHVGLCRGRELHEIAALIHAAAREQAAKVGAAMVVWKDFQHGDRVALDTLVESTGTFRLPSYPGSSIPLVSGGYPAFLATLQSRRRHKMLKRLRQGGTRLPLTTTVTRQPSPTEIGCMFELYQQTYARGKTKFERLTPDFFTIIAKSEESTFVVQRHRGSGTMLSFMLLFDLGERVINQFIGIDYGAAEGGFAYFQLFAAGYDWACTTKARVMQSGQTGYMAKLETGHALVPLWNYCEHRNALVNRLFRRVAGRVTWETLDGDLREWLVAHPEALPQ